MNQQQTIASSSDRGCITPSIVIRGLPGVGKTTLANAVVARLRRDSVITMHVNADAVRSTLNKDLGFALKDRIENARRLGATAFLAASNGIVPVVDFVMPTKATFDVFVDALGDRNVNIWSISAKETFKSRFEDTEKIFQPLEEFWGGAVFDHLYNLAPYQEDMVESIAEKLVSVYYRNVKESK